MLFGSAVLSMSLARLAYNVVRPVVLGNAEYLKYEMFPHYVAFGIAVLVVYLPVFAWLSDRLNDKRQLLLFALVGAVLGLAPAYGLHLWGEPHVADLLSVEAVLTYGLFGVAGALLGPCYVKLSSDPSIGGRELL